MKKVLHRIDYLVLTTNMAALFDTALQHLKTRRVVNSCWSNTYCSPIFNNIFIVIDTVHIHWVKVLFSEFEYFPQIKIEEFESVCLKNICYSFVL